MEELYTLREQIDDIDRQLAQLFARRMSVTDRVGAYKAAHGLPVLDREREQQVLTARASLVDEAYREDVASLFEAVMAVSRRRQEENAAETCGDRL